MRMLISIIIALIILIGAGLLINNSLQASSDQLGIQIDEICGNIEEEDWEQAGRKTWQLENTWQQNARWWPVFLDHQEMDNIEFSLAKAKVFVEAKDNTLALAQFAELKIMIEHLPQKEKLNVKNIL